MIGRPLVRALVDAGHEVVGIARSDESRAVLESLGATGVVCDVYDRDRLVGVVVGAAPELILDELTDLPDDPADIARDGASGNARIRREGTDNLLAAASAAGVTRFVVQSVAWPLTGDGGDAVRHMEDSVLAIGGTVVRYGQFYGPGTYHATRPDEGPVVQVDEAARRTLELLERPGEVIVVVD